MPDKDFVVVISEMLRNQNFQNFRIFRMPVYNSANSLIL